MSGKFAWVVEYIGFEVQNVAGRQRGEWNKDKDSKGLSLILSIILVFCILGMVVFSVARKISSGCPLQQSII